jgi:enterochelin esterase-like enzyme
MTASEMVGQLREEAGKIKTAEGDLVTVTFYRKRTRNAENDSIVILTSLSKSSNTADHNRASSQAVALQLVLASSGDVGCIRIEPRDDGTFGGLTRSCANGLMAMFAYVGDRWEGRSITLVSEAEACLAANLLLMKRNLSDPLALQANEALLKRVALVVNISGLSDLTTLVHWCRYNGCSETEVNEALGRFGTASRAMLAVAGTKESVPAMANSPLFYVRRGLPGFILIHDTASRGAPFQQSKALYTFLRRKGVNAVLYLFDCHEFDLCPDLLIKRFSTYLKRDCSPPTSMTGIVLAHPGGDRAMPSDKSSAPYDVCSDRWIDPIDVHFDKVIKRCIASKVLETEVEIGVYLPPAHSNGSIERFPVIYWLPGADQTLRAGFFFIETLDSAIARGEAHQSIVVLLQRPREECEEFARVGVAGFDNFVTAELLPFIDREYKTVAARSGRTLEGVCSGANAALRLALSFSGHFSAVSAISPYWGRWNAVLAKALGDDPALLLPQVMEERPRMRIIAGTKDPSWSGARALATHLEAATCDVQFVSISGLGRNAIGIYDRLGTDAFSFFKPLVEVRRDIHESLL